MALTDQQNIFFIGINGSGMRGLAYLLEKQGKAIAGTDSNMEDAEKGGQYELATEEEAGPLLAKADLVIYSDAVAPDHPLRRQAEADNKSILSYQEALGQFAQGFTNVIAVTGTHGKSSTTAMLAHIFIEAGANPTVLVGASVPQWNNRNAYAGGQEYFIVEADEYREHFLYLQPTHAIIINIEWDHPDYFLSIDEVRDAFQKFTGSVKKLIVTSPALHEWVTQWSSVMILSTDPSARLQDDIAILPGEHMKSNARLAAVMAYEVLGVVPEQALQHLTTFKGLSRRFELIGQIAGKDIYSDYGHHPTEITATLKAAQEKFPDKKILVCFEAHTAERLHALWLEFVACLSIADGVIIVPVFRPAGRTLQGQDFALEKQLGEALEKQTNVWLCPTYDELKPTLHQVLVNYDLVLAFTAGVLDGKLRNLV